MQNHITVDRDAEARAVANADKLADLADAYQDHQEAHRVAVAEVARIERAWKLGDGTPTAQDHVLAVTEVTRSESLLKRAGQDLQSADSAAHVRSFDLATEVARKVADLYGNTRTVISDRLPSEAPKVGNNPLLYVVQSREAHDEGGGVLAADIGLSLFGKSRIVAAPPREDIAQLFTDAGWIVDVTRRDPERVGDAWRSSVRLRIKRGWLAVPLIDPDASGAPRHAENRTEVGGVSLLVDMLRSELAYVAEGAGNALLKFTHGGAASTITTDAGKVTRERLTLGFSVEFDRAPYAPLVDVACSGLVGILAPRLGVVESVASGVQPERGFSRTFTFVRREPAYVEHGDSDDQEPQELDDQEPRDLRDDSAKLRQWIAANER